jgi:hypothetical protein
VLDWLEQTDYAVWVRESWGWPIALTLHAFGMAVVVSVMFVMALRLFGLFRPLPYRWLTRLVPIVWIGIACQILSGLTLLITKPVQYLSDVIFDSKMGLLLASLVMMLVFQTVLKREAVGWDATGRVSSRGLQLVAATALLWAAVTIGGRLTAYLGSLYL